MTVCTDSAITATAAPQDDAITIGEYEIPEVNVARFEREIDAINRKAAKIGCPPVTLERLGEIVKRRWYTAYDADGQPFEKKGDFLHVRVRVTGTTPRYDGWSLGGTLEGTEAGTIVRSVPGVELPAQYQTADPTLCEHCGKRRRRSATFVLVHEDGRTLQVGRQCIKDFLGGLDPQALAAMAEYLQSLSSAGERFGGSGERVHELGEYLAYVCAAVREHGYLSASQARNGDGKSTSGRASHQMRLDAGETQRAKWDEDWTITEADTAEAESIITEARATLALVEQPNDYQHNLGVLLQLDYVRARNEGYVASVYGYIKRLHEQRAARQAEERRAATRTNEWVGTVGKRETFELTFMGYRAFQGDWGDRYLNKWEDPTGNAVNWWTGTSDDYKEGVTYRVKATVKAHDEYKGRKQTIITRAAVGSPVSHCRCDQIDCCAIPVNRRPRA